PELVTVAGRHALSCADVVVADRLAPRALLEELPAHVELIDVAKLPRGRAASQDHINDVLIARAQAGQRVVRFKGGDNFVFGRGFEEVEACAAAGVPVTVIPGLSSALAVPALSGIPVTHRGVAHEFTVVSGHLPPSHPDSLVEWAAVGQMRGTVVLLMAVANAGPISAALMAGGRAADTPVAVIVDGTMPTERVERTSLAELADTIERRGLSAPAIIVVGPVVALSDG
ncbi:MAG: uroporphyrinogen-III C-methyltransferase, partial [Nocardioides sp.]